MQDVSGVFPNLILSFPSLAAICHVEADTAAPSMVTLSLSAVKHKNHIRVTEEDILFTPQLSLSVETNPTMGSTSVQ